MVVLSADTEKAFLMVSMAEKDRDVLRFLWVDDNTKDEPEIIAFCFIRVVFHRKNMLQIPACCLYGHAYGSPSSR